MAAIQTARYSNLLGALLNIGGMEGVASELGAEVSPVFVLENDRPEWGFLKGERLLGAFVSQAANAGNPSFARIRNPLNSNVLGVIEAMSIGAATTFNPVVYMGQGVADRANPGTVTTRDSRITPLNGAGALKVSADNTAVAGSVLEAAFILANTMWEPICLPLILHPGFFIDFGVTDLNLSMRTNLRFRERAGGAYEFPA